jgi:hypothetical protein
MLRIVTVVQQVVTKLKRAETEDARAIAITKPVLFIVNQNVQKNS